MERKLALRGITGPDTAYPGLHGCWATRVRHRKRRRIVSAHDPEATTLLDELKWVHSLLRRDLRTCERLARSVADGATSTEVQSEIRYLQAGGPLFQLRVNCLHYCRFVHGHHGAEDVALFPAVRQADARLNAVVDRLEADHRAVSLLLDDVEATAGALNAGDSTLERRKLVDALNELSTRLLEHLAFEEESLAPVLGTWRQWPFLS